MRAYSTAGGGVMFIPDEIERETKSHKVKSYKDLAPASEAKDPVRLFGRKKKDDRDMKEAA